MTLEEFSDSFDTLLNSYANKSLWGDQASHRDVVLDEYEKSVFLTKAQEELVISLYSGRNNYGSAFEETEELRRYLATIVKEVSLLPITNSSGNIIGIDSKSKFFTLPTDVWYITYEAINTKDRECDDEHSMDVQPVTQDEYHRVKRNPFRGANRRRALRLDLADGVIEIVCKYNIDSYYIRYLRRPNPIVLVDLSDEGFDGLTIDGFTGPSPCELHEALHYKILERAVLLAIQSKSIGSSKSE